MYCTQCGRQLPSSGICPKCAKAPPRGAVHPMGKTVYDFCGSPTFLILTLLWTLATLWAAYSLLPVSLLPLLLLIPDALFCLGFWITFFSRKGSGKQAGLRLASGALLLLITLLTILLAALCLVSFYGIFLCTSDREYNSLVPGFLKLVLVLFLLMPLSVLFLNKLRKIIRTARGVLRGNRGMAICPVTAILYCVLFAAGGVALFLLSAQADSNFVLILHAISRLPFGLGTYLAPLEALTWQLIAPVLLGYAAALVGTAVILIFYRVKLQHVKKEILLAGSRRTTPEHRIAGDPVQLS